MNIIIFTPDDIVSDIAGAGLRVEFKDSRRLDHIHNILKSCKGDILKVGLLNGNLGQGSICDITRNGVLLDVDLNETPPAPSPITLLLALPRPLVVRRILADTTSFGVKKIILFHSERVEKSYWQSPVLEADAITAQLIKGLEQGRDTQMPEVQKCRNFRSFLEDQSAVLTKGVDGLAQAYVGQPGSTLHLPGQILTPTLIAIGPEGGLLPHEVDVFLDKGFQAVNLGSRLLRVETAVSAVLGRLSIPGSLSEISDHEVSDHEECNNSE
jgi:16S rRNA (uracil1498-N3)-methyltransferase